MMPIPREWLMRNWGLSFQDGDGRSITDKEQMVWLTILF